MKNPGHYNYCNKKIKFDSEASAKAMAEKRSMWYYQCPRCRKWHLTSKRPAPIAPATRALFDPQS